MIHLTLGDLHSFMAKIGSEDIRTGLLPADPSSQAKRRPHRKLRAAIFKASDDACAVLPERFRPRRSRRSISAATAIALLDRSIQRIGLQTTLTPAQELSPFALAAKGHACVTG